MLGPKPGTACLDDVERPGQRPYGDLQTATERGRFHLLLGKVRRTSSVSPHLRLAGRCSGRSRSVMDARFGDAPLVVVGEDGVMATRLWSVVFDAADPLTLGRWWSTALGWPVTFEAADEVEVSSGIDGVPSLVFGTAADTKVGKNRVHLDLASDSPEAMTATVQRLLAAGASTVEIGQSGVPWVVLADPEGNELCVLEPRDRYRGIGALAAIVVDAADPAGLADFWEQAAGWSIGSRSDDGVSLYRPGGHPPDLDLVRVPGPKAVKNRVHLDVAPWPDDDRDTEAARLVGLGATMIDVGQGEVTWRVLADPEGNELCVLRPR